MNIWRDIDKERINPSDFIACIEISKGTKSKYELDKQTGMIYLDRVLYTSTIYPMNYGFIPLTYENDGDPVDVFVLCSEPIISMALVKCFPIGVVKMIDRKTTDNKVIAIPFNDPQYNCYKDISELPAHIMEELRHFLTVYKQLENKVVEVECIEGNEAAKEVIREGIDLYNKTFNKK